MIFNLVGAAISRLQITLHNGRQIAAPTFSLDGYILDRLLPPL